MRLLLDMNLPPRWVEYLQQHDIESVHWSTVGDERASDVTIMSYARDNGFVVFTHDLDFSMLLALSHAAGPSVLQARTQDVFPEAIGPRIVRALRSHSAALDDGAIVTVYSEGSRVRVLPIGRRR